MLYSIKAFLKEKVGPVLSCLKQTFSSKVKGFEAPQAVSLERKSPTNILSKTKLNSEMEKLQNEFIKYMNSYKLEVKNLEEFIKILNKSSSSKEF